MLERYCDILVIGSEIPGLVTAAFLAKRGLSVQVVEPNLFADHTKLPDPDCLTNLNSKLLRSILGRLNVPEMTIQNFLSSDSTLQVIFKQNRIDILNNPLEYFEEIEREFVDSYQNIKIFYENQAKLRHQTDVGDLFQKLLPSSWKEERQFKKFIQEKNLNEKSEEYIELCKLSTKLSSFLRAQYMLGYQNICEKPFAYQISELFNPGDGEVFSIHAGTSVLKNMLLDRIAHYDGGLRNKVQINELLFRNGVFEGAELDDGHGSVLSKYIIWNASLEKLAELLPKKWRFRKLRKKCQRQKNNYHWFTAVFSVESTYIPDPMKDNSLVISDSSKELLGENFLYLQLDRPKLEERGHIKVNFLLPPSALKEGPEFFDNYFSLIQSKLIEIMPFCEKSIKLEFPKINPEQPADTLFPLNDNDYEIFRYSAEHHGITQIDEKNFFNLCPLHYKTPTPNFFLSNPAIFSAFGIESKLILGLKITDIIWQEVEKIKKRAMKSERRIA